MFFLVIDTVDSTSMTDWEIDRERDEFKRAAKLYRPLSSTMAERFTTETKEVKTEEVVIGQGKFIIWFSAKKV